MTDADAAPQLPYQRPDWVRRLNYFGDAVGDPALIVPLDPDEMLEAARTSTGLTDVGDDFYLEAFRRRMTSIAEESKATLLGRLLARAEAIRVLQTRLRLNKAWADHPEILDEPINAPIFVVGPPRTGTSILLELLALDPSMRSPISWEAHHPLPVDHTNPGQVVWPTDDSEIQAGVAERMAWGEAEQELWADIQPEFQTVHELRHDLPCECIHFWGLNFTSGYWGMQYNTPSFAEWEATQPDVAARLYADHRRFLQTMQWQDRQAGRHTSHWLLKTPGHMVTMRELFGEYPDARIVMTHRDPMKWVVSAASTMSILRWLRSEHVDLAEHAMVASLGFRFLAEQLLEWRTNGSVPDERFVDSHFADLMADAPTAIRKIYDKLELPWPHNHGQTVGDYLTNKPKGKFGAHTYTMETYGLNAAEIKADYANYVEHFGIAEE